MNNVSAMAGQTHRNAHDDERYAGSTFMAPLGQVVVAQGCQCAAELAQRGVSARCHGTETSASMTMSRQTMSSNRVRASNAAEQKGMPVKNSFVPEAMLEGPTAYRTHPESASRRWAADTRERVAAMTLSDYLETIWIPRRRHELEPTSFLGAKGNVDRYIAPYFRDTRIRDLTTDVIQAFYQHVLTTPRAMGRPLAKQTVIRMHAVLHRALQELVIAEVLARNPCDGARPRERKSDRPEIRIWTPAQLRDFLNWAANDRLFPLWRTLGFTGLRRGEALGLQWRDLRFHDRLLAVRRALVTAGTSTYLTAPKSSQSRVIDLDEETVTVLREHQQRSLRLAGDSPDDFVFTDRSGDSLVPNLVTRQFRGLVCASPVPRIRLHDLRHTHASHLLESGASISSVQERLGHSDVVVTLNLYSHVLPGSQRLAVDRLESFYDVWGSRVDQESSARLNE